MARTGPAIHYKGLTIIHQAYLKEKTQRARPLGTENGRGKGSVHLAHTL